MAQPRANLGEILGNFRGIIDIFKNFQELLPIILEIVECFKGMTPDEQQTSMTLIAKFASDTEEGREEIRQQLQQLVS